MSDVLRGSPYILEDPDLLMRDLAKFENRCREQLKLVRQKLSGANLLIGLADPAQGAREVYESNAIEGVGPDRPSTVRILARADTSFVDEGFNQELFAQAIQGDDDLRAVLGLQGARILSRRMVAGSDSRTFSLAEYEIRGLHSIICEGESHAGMYKRWHVKIGGPDSHEPHLPIDVSSSMRQMVQWINQSGHVGPILRSAIAHAWLTHIHPFEDGNGRIARLLANQILIADGLPPAIIKNQGQRGAYLDALRRSDEGDILPFVHIFRTTLGRYVREMDKERYLRKVLRAELDGRGSSDYEAWSHSFLIFLDSLFAELALAKLTIIKRDFPDEEAYSFLRDREKDGNTWIAFIRDDEGRVLLMWLGYQSDALRRPTDESFSQPSIFFSVANNWNSLTPYRQVKDELFGLREVCVLVDLTVYSVTGKRVRYGEYSDAALEVSNVLISAFQERRVPVQDRSGSVARLPS